MSLRDKRSLVTRSETKPTNLLDGIDFQSSRSDRTDLDSVSLEETVFSSSREPLRGIEPLPSGYKADVLAIKLQRHQAA